MTEYNKKLIGEFVYGLTNQHNTRAREMYCATQFIYHFNTRNVPKYLAGVKLLSEQILTAFPNVSTKINVLIAENDWVVEQASATATHLGDFMRVSL